MNTERGEDELHKSYQGRPYSALIMEIRERSLTTQEHPYLITVAPTDSAQ
jgi:hypothetical protein